MPYPDARRAQHRGLDGHVAHDFLRRVSVHRQRNRAALEVTSSNWRCQINLVAGIEGLFVLPPDDLHVVHTSPPPVDILDMRFRALYFDALATVYAPSISRICNIQAAELDNESAKYARRGILAPCTKY